MEFGRVRFRQNLICSLRGLGQKEFGRMILVRPCFWERLNMMQGPCPKVAVLTALLALTVSAGPKPSAAKETPTQREGKPPYNIVFLICDQESYHLRAQDDFV